MPKTKDAFAFRDFDGEHILWQRLHDYLFKDDTLSDIYDQYEDFGSDEYVLDHVQSLASNDMDNDNFGSAEFYAEWLKKLLREVDRRVVTRICRHVGRLEAVNRKFNAIFLSTDDVPLESVRRQMRRVNNLLNSYSGFLVAAEALTAKIQDAIDDIEFSLKSQFTTAFPARLREARKKAGLTQKQVADKLGMTQGAYTQYENQRREPSITTLCRLSRILKQPTDWLLGLN